MKSGLEVSAAEAGRVRSIEAGLTTLALVEAAPRSAPRPGVAVGGGVNVLGVGSLAGAGEPATASKEAILVATMVTRLNAAAVTGTRIHGNLWPELLRCRRWAGTGVTVLRAAEEDFEGGGG